MPEFDLLSQCETARLFTTVHGVAESLRTLIEYWPVEWQQRVAGATLSAGAATGAGEAAVVAGCFPATGRSGTGAGTLTVAEACAQHTDAPREREHTSIFTKLKSFANRLTGVGG